MFHLEKRQNLSGPEGVVVRVLERGPLRAVVEVQRQRVGVASQLSQRIIVT